MKDHLAMRAVTFRRLILAAGLATAVAGFSSPASAAGPYPCGGPAGWGPGWMMGRGYGMGPGMMGGYGYGGGPGPWMMDRGYGMGPGMMGGNGYGGGAGPWMMGRGYGMGPGMMGGYGYGGGAGPWMMGRGYGMGPGMMGGNGYGGRHWAMGPWMMGWGQGQATRPGSWMVGPGGGSWAGSAQANLDLSVAQVKARMEHWLKALGNPNIQLGAVVEHGPDTITADIVTTDKDALVQRYDIDRRTGAVTPAAAATAKSASPDMSSQTPKG